jgi:hypothetical protein
MKKPFDIARLVDRLVEVATAETAAAV